MPRPAGGRALTFQMPMLNTKSLLVAVVWVLVAGTGAWAAPMNKCVVNGAVTYQQAPCPGERPARRPTLEELNAEARARRAAAASAVQAPTPTPTPAAPANAAATGEKSKAFHCDGRQHCSQMTSCDEAKYFLANCPGVLMDGDRNGIPCERQWCNRW